MGMLVGLSFASVVDADPPSSMAQWKMANFSTEELGDGTSDDLASPSGDGVSNLLKYALNLDPHVRHFSPLTAAISPKGGNTFSLQFTQNPLATDIAYMVETSNDLRTWNSGPDYTEQVPTVSNPDGTQTVTAQDKTAPPAGANKQIRFMRLRVVRNKLDTDGDGLPDDWEARYFHNLWNGSVGDFDGYGLTNLQEFQAGSDPTDFYNDQLPLLQIASGDGQFGAPNTTLTQPLVVEVRNQAGALLANAPDELYLTQGERQISDSSTRANPEGLAFVYFTTSAETGAMSTISAFAGRAPNRANTSFQVGSVKPPNPPSDVVVVTNPDGSIDMTWSDNSDNEQDFGIQLRNADGEWETIGTVPANTTSVHINPDRTILP